MQVRDKNSESHFQKTQGRPESRLNRRDSVFNRPIHLPPLPPTRLAFVEVCCFPVILFFAWAIFWAWVGSFYTRMMGDDYYFGGYLHRHGFWGSCVRWYYDWHGRWFSQILLNAVFSFEDWIVSLIPSLLLGVWAASLASAIYVLTAWPRALVFRCVVIVLGVTLITTPQLVESVYWSASSLYHTVPLALCGFIVPCLWGNNRSPLRLSFTALLAFCLAGCSETFTIVWVPLLLSVALWRRDRYSLWAFLGALAGALLMPLAPGNAIRAAASAPRWGAMRILERSWALGNLCWSPSHKGALYLAMAVVFVLGLRYGMKRFNVRWYHPAFCIGWAYCAAILTQAPSVYALGHIPFERVMIIPMFFIAAGLLIAALLLGVWCQQRFEAPAALQSKTPRFTLAGALLLYLSVLWLSDYVLVPPTHVASMRAFSQEWTQRDRSIRQQIEAGQRVVTISRLKNADFTADIAEPTYYVNEFMALHYSPDFEHPVRIEMK